MNLNKKSSMEGIGGRKRKVGNEIIIVSKIKIKMVHFLLLITFLVALAKKKCLAKVTYGVKDLL